MSSTPDPQKIKLLEAVQKEGLFWEASMQSDAIAVVHATPNKQAQALNAAKLSLARHEAAQNLSKKVVDLIHAYWPNPAGSREEVPATSGQSPAMKECEVVTLNQNSTSACYRG